MRHFTGAKLAPSILSPRRGWSLTNKPTKWSISSSDISVLIGSTNSISSWVCSKLSQYCYLLKEQFIQLGWWSYYRQLPSPRFPTISSDFIILFMIFQCFFVISDLRSTVQPAAAGGSGSAHSAGRTSRGGAAEQAQQHLLTNCCRPIPNLQKYAESTSIPNGNKNFYCWFSAAVYIFNKR